ncbi:MAG: tyrosine-type recombinase/integrase [Bacteroidales bacterium]|nr:tyrosine-type recombinase/integrase [Bacteroidales bacterium]MEE1221357.1 tyrosine-type recombinase/integrase [Bacteroidales bacterium]
MWEEYLDEFKSYILFVRSLSVNTFEAYQRDCTKFFNFMNENYPEINIHTVELKHLEEFLWQINLKNSSTRRIISGIKAYFKFLVLTDRLDNNPCELLKTSRIEKLLPVVLSHEEIQKMLSVIDKSTYHGFRDSVIIEVLYACGLRISELLNLKKGDIYFKHEYIKVLGKGNKERLVPIGEKALQLLDLYIRNHRSKLKKIDQKCKDIVFLNRRGRKLTRQYVFLAIKTAAQQAEIKKNIHPHILRHSFASALVKGGANLIVVKEMMGHASVVSTEIYTHLDTTHLRETLMLYHPHYQNLNKKKSEESQ